MLRAIPASSLHREQRLVADASTIAIPGRKNFLNDNRTWPISTRIEMLFQKEIITAEAYRELDVARKSRNAFIHEGETPEIEAVKEALSGMFRLLSTCVTNGTSELELDTVKTMILKRVRWEGSPNPSEGPIEPSYWRELPLLPGEKNFKGDLNRSSCISVRSTRSCRRASLQWRTGQRSASLAPSATRGVRLRKLRGSATSANDL